ncbi:MAG: TlpA disulfide reductase family protein [Myxococcota bacterium]|nr:TlpA disulfide reductase family protein [Myxococcota bacterium]
MNDVVSNALHGLCVLAVIVLSGCLDEPDVQPEAMCAQSSGAGASGEETACTDVGAGDRSLYPGLEKLSELYGTEAGDTIADLQFVRGDGMPFSLSEIHSDPTRKVILFTTSAGWCAACIEEQPKLQALHGEYFERGLTILVVLFEYQDYRPADAKLALQWQRRYKLDYTVVADPPFVSQPYYPNGDASATPLVLLIDVDTMEILDVSTGFNEDVVRSIIEKTL